MLILTNIICLTVNYNFNSASSKHTLYDHQLANTEYSFQNKRGRMVREFWSIVKPEFLEVRRLRSPTS